MNLFVAILGLAFLILIHEAGHFFVALAVGMRPRKFYLGFPPAAGQDEARRDRVRGRRDPARRLREDPRDAPARAGGRRRALRAASLEQRPELAGAGAAAEARGRGRERGGRRRRCVERDRSAIVGDKPPAGFERGSRRSLDGLSPQAYWRQSTWQPDRGDPRRAGDELPPRRDPLHVSSSWPAAARRRPPSTRCCPASRRPRSACSPATRSSPSTASSSARPTSRPRSRGSKGKPVTLTVQRGTRVVTLGPVRPAADRRRVSARLHPARREARLRRVGVAVARS